MIAFFDMDRTLISANSGALWPRYLHRKGKLSTRALLRASWWLLLYRFAVLDMDRVARLVIARMAGDSEEALRDECRRWMREEVARFVRADARRRIEDHRRAGEVCAILSSSSLYAAEPMGEMLGLDGVVCTRLEVAGGRFTGRLVDPLCYGAGKVALAGRFAAERGVRLDACAFYTDSYTDLPMLAAVGRPVAVNPDWRLGREARRRGWTIENWT